ncbi:MAG: hypothetical protein AB7G12_10985 [Thermoanaerobaculia bacterium]
MPLRESQVEAVSLTVGRSIPPLEVAVARDREGRWIATLVDKSVLLRGLEQVIQDQPGPLSADALAELVARLGVDPDPGNGVVVRGAADIPADRDSSDTYRDLKARGLSEGDIRSRLVPKDLPAECAAPNRANDGRVSFCTWAYYDGALVSWRIDPRGAVSISRKEIARHLGSYKLLM